MGVGIIAKGVAGTHNGSLSCLGRRIMGPSWVLAPKMMGLGQKEGALRKG